MTARAHVLDALRHRQPTKVPYDIRFTHDARRKMALRAEMDLIFDEALKKLSTKRANVSGQLSDQLSDGMMVQLMAELAAEPQQPGTAKTLQAARPATVVSGNHQEREDFLAQDKG